MNRRVLKELEHQLTIQVGAISIIDGATDDDKMLIANVKASLIGLVHGIRNVVDHMEDTQPMTLGALEAKQFDNAKEVRQ